MILYLPRHGIAVDRDTEGIALDSERPLTEQGALCAIQVLDLLSSDANVLLWLLAPRQLRALASPSR